MTSSWYLTRPVAGSGPVVAWRTPRPAATAAPAPTTSAAAAPAPRPARAAFRTHRTLPARPPRRRHLAQEVHA